jgi:hypothetical protein
MVVAVAQEGKPELFCGTARPDLTETFPERQHLGAIHYLALKCDATE